MALTQVLAINLYKVLPLHVSKRIERLLWHLYEFFSSKVINANISMMHWNVSFMSGTANLTASKKFKTYHLKFRCTATISLVHRSWGNSKPWQHYKGGHWSFLIRNSNHTYRNKRQVRKEESWEVECPTSKSFIKETTVSTFRNRYHTNRNA